MAKREVGTLWIGGELTWLEQVSLKSYVDKKQDITLFHYGPIQGVPDGVKLRDGREIIDTDDFIKYEQKDSFALFADWFRLHMIHKCPGMIWIDTDVYCWQPMTYDEDEVFGRELHGKKRVNNAVLGMDADGDLLRAMLDFTEDRYPDPEFLNKFRRADIAKAREEGAPLHVSQLPWGVWGPLMVTHFVKKMNYLPKAKPVEAFYPVTFPERKLFLKAPRRAMSKFTDETTALHLWASNKKPIGYHHDGVPPEGSFFDRICKETDIDASAAPVKSRGVHKFENADEDA